jgi:hypothetical protein
MSTRRLTAALLVIAASVGANTAAGQACSSADGRCRFGARAAEAALSGAALAAAGGNPWMGSASTLGYRMASAPRFAAQARALFAGIDLPASTGTELDGATLFGLAAGVSVSIIDGISPAATVGGLGSVDLFAEAGTVLLPDGFESVSLFTWSLGARIGVFRESFTLPGITASLAYRRIDDVTFDDVRAPSRLAAFGWSDASVWSVRAVAGKRLLGLGLTGGLGWDGSSANADIGYRTAAGAAATAAEDVDADRYNAFIDATWTSLILSLSAEAGWQWGPDEQELGVPDPAAGGRFFGGLSARLTF